MESLVIISTIGNNKSADGEETIKPVDGKGLSNAKKPIPVDVEKLIVIYYKYQY